MTKKELVKAIEDFPGSAIVKICVAKSNTDLHFYEVDSVNTWDKDNRGDFFLLAKQDG